MPSTSPPNASTAYRCSHERHYWRTVAGSKLEPCRSRSFAELAEEGKLTLEDPLRRWLPDYANITNTITIRQLLNHTSGVFDWVENTAVVRNTSTDAYRNFLCDPLKYYTPQETLAYVKAPYFAPGRGWHYSNTGYPLLGLIVEVVTGHPIAHG